MQFENDAALDRDRDWIARIRRGDSTAITEVHAEYGVHLCAYAYRLTGSRDAAEERVQDVFLGIWRSREQWQFTGPVNAYLLRAARNRDPKPLRRDRAPERLREPAPAAADPRP